MAEKKIVITIEDGKITSEVFGAVGNECDSIDGFLASVGDVKSKQKKPEYYKKNKNGALKHDNARG